jgi:serine/threonine-protein kinase
VLEIGALFGRYRIEAVLGEGGMGRVYRAHDTTLSRRIALKVITAEPGVDPTRWADAKARMLREAQAAAAFDHPNAVGVFDVGEIDGLPFIAMEFIEGTTLRRYVGDSATPWSVKLAFLVDVAHALGAAHEAHLVHRDVKPDNVMVRADGRVKVLDFGIARRAAVEVAVDGPTQAQGGLPTLTGKGAIIGTPLYMAPEQILGRDLDGRADQFAWGVTAYELMANTPPWQAPDTVALMAAVLTEPCLPLRQVAPDVPHELEAVIGRTLEKDRANRYPSMADVVAAVEAFMTPERAGSVRPSGRMPARAGTASLPRAPSPAWRGRRWAIAGGGLLVASVALVSLVAWHKRRTQATSAVAPASGVTTAVTMLTLPPPKSGSSQAVAAYLTGVRADHAASVEAGWRAFEEAIALDPMLAEGHLRLSRHLRPSVARAHFQKAQALRASLSDRDQAILEALEPAIQRDPPSFADQERSLAAAAARFANDAEIHYLLARAQFLLGRMEEASASAERALALDPEFALPLYLKAFAARYVGRAEESVAATDRCLQVAPNAMRCLELRIEREEFDGRCEDVQRDAKRWAAVAPDSMEPLTALAAVAMVVGGPRETAEELLRQRWSLADEATRKLNELADRAALDQLDGNFDRAEKLLHDAERTAASFPNLWEHSNTIMTVAELHAERGDVSGAGRIAADYLKRRDAWVAAPRTDEFALREEPTPRMLGILRQAGAMTAAELAEKRDTWIRRWKGRVPSGQLWVHGYAAAAVTREDAILALAALPSYEPLPGYQESLMPSALVGRVYLLAGQLDRAVPFLERAARDCRVLAYPVLWMQAHAWLGEAYEKAGNKDGACEAYRLVLTRWANARSSVSARDAKQRSLALHCGGKR